MSLLNQPSRILISGDDAEWTSNNMYGGQSINITLPEAVVGAMGVDCARAVVPTTQYNIPDYQKTLYYTEDGVVKTLTLTNNRYFATVPDLITQLNADAVAQGDAITFAYSTTTTRVSATFTNQYKIVVNALNKGIALRYTPPLTAQPTVFAVANIAEGTYYTRASFASAVQTAIQAVVNTVSATAQPAYNVFAGVVVSTGPTPPGPQQNMLGIAITGGTTQIYPGIWDIQYFNSGLTAQQISANKALIGIDDLDTFSQIIAGSLGTGTPANPTTFDFPIPVANIVYSMTPKKQWLTPFALNTRLGYPNAGLPATSYVCTGTFLPNILRTRVIYLLCNATINDSITTDGLRNVLAKIPVNSVYGGMTVYSPPDFNFCRIVQSSYQNVELSLLDENYQPYNLTVEEPMEVELVFAYTEIKNGQ